MPSVQSKKMEDDGMVVQNKMRMALNMLRSKECIKDKRLRMLHRHYPLKKLTDRILLFPIQFQIQMGFSQLMFHLGIGETRSKPLPGRYNRDDNLLEPIRHNGYGSCLAVYPRAWCI